MKKSRWLALCTCLLLLAGCAGSVSAPVGEATLPAPTATRQQQTALPLARLPQRQWRDLPYVPEGDLNQRLDIYLPETGEGPFPAILAFHGGGFYTGSKAEYGRLAGAFTGMGYAFVPADYRLTPVYSYPAQVEDLFCALAWVHTNHEMYGLDDQQIIVMGESAGGYLAAMLATVDTPSAYLGNCPHALPASDWVQAAVIFYGPYEYPSIDGYPPRDVESILQPYWGAELGDIPPEKLAEMSPMSWVDGSEPPFLLIHGTSDTAVPSWMAEEFATALEEAGVDVALLLLEADHAFLLRPLSSPENVQALEAVDAFLSALPEQ